MNDPSHNPYAPPKAAVAEPLDDEPTMAPPPVKTAMKLLWVSFALTYVEIALDWVALMAESALIPFVIWMALASLLQIWIYLNIARGRNWARITWLVLFAISLPFVFAELPEMARRAPLAAGVTSIDQLLVVFCFYLLFFPGRAWFRKRPAS